MAGWWKQETMSTCYFVLGGEAWSLSAESTMCLFMWRERWSEREKLREHSVHLKGFWPVCLRKWRVSSSERANRQEHPSHWQMYGFSPVCVRQCALRWLLFVYTLPQPWTCRKRERERKEQKKNSMIIIFTWKFPVEIWTTHCACKHCVHDDVVLAIYFCKSRLFRMHFIFVYCNPLTFRCRFNFSTSIFYLN